MDEEDQESDILDALEVIRKRSSHAAFEPWIHTACFIPGGTRNRIGNRLEIEDKKTSSLKKRKMTQPCLLKPR